MIGKTVTHRLVHVLVLYFLHTFDAFRPVAARLPKDPAAGRVVDDDELGL